MAKQRKYKPKDYESIGNSDDVSSNIYMSMLLSDSWQSLTKSQQILYVYCKAQLYAEKRKPVPVAVELTEEERQKCFTMNKAKWCKLYRLYSSGRQDSFFRDMNALIENGFIKLVENGKNTRTKNIYMFSSEWVNKKE